MPDKLIFYFLHYHKNKYHVARHFLDKLCIITHPIIENDSVSANIRGRHGYYAVYIGEDGVSCSCPANRGQGYVCWHVIAVALFFVEKYDYSEEKILNWLKKYEKRNMQSTLI